MYLQKYIPHSCVHTYINIAVAASRSFCVHPCQLSLVHALMNALASLHCVSQEVNLVIALHCYANATHIADFYTVFEKLADSQKSQ